MKIPFSKIVFALFLFSLYLFPGAASAGTSHNMSGWAWSSNIGWISFNCTNVLGSCDQSNYGVNKNPDGTLTGHAWSSNIGWISFNRADTGNPPSGSGTTDPGNGSGAMAKVTGSKLTGWARALSNGDGWDGWISLSGTNYGVIFNNSSSSFGSYAWGDEVVGWVDFSLVIVGPSSTMPDLTASVPSPTSVTVGTSNFSSTITNAGTAPTSVGFTNLFQISKSSDGTTKIDGTSNGPTNYEVTGMSALDVGGTAVTSKSLTLSVGTYYMRVCADNNTLFVGAVSESNEGNNCSSGTPWTQINVTPVGGCVSNVGSVCTSAANSCGDTNSNGTVQCDGSCSSTIPPEPANGICSGIPTTGTCFDGFMNGDETGIDTGGRCGVNDVCTSGYTGTPPNCKKKKPIFIED